MAAVAANVLPENGVGHILHLARRFYGLVVLLDFFGRYL